MEGQRGVYQDTDVDVILKGLPEKQRPREAGSEGTIQVLWQWWGTMATAGLVTTAHGCGRRRRRPG